MTGLFECYIIGAFSSLKKSYVIKIIIGLIEIFLTQTFLYGNEAIIVDCEIEFTSDSFC